MLLKMRILRGMIVGWMVFWLGASGALSAVMPWCDHMLQRGAAMDGLAMQMQDGHAPSHHGHENATAGSPYADHASHHGSEADNEHSGIACDQCGACNLMSSAIAAAALLDGVTQLNAVRDSFVLAHFRGRFPEQPYHPPRISRPA